MSFYLFLLIVTFVFWGVFCAITQIKKDNGTQSTAKYFLVFLLNALICPVSMIFAISKIHEDALLKSEPLDDK